jgi:hypothetical protein
VQAPADFVPNAIGHSVVVQRRRWRAHLAAVGAYVLLAVVFSWPLPVHLQTHLTGDPNSDTGVYVWNLWVFQYEVLDHRTMPYFTDRIFRATGRANLSLHNYTVFALQRRFYLLGLPFVTLPIRVPEKISQMTAASWKPANRANSSSVSSLPRR